MVRSMTGFGRGEVSGETGVLTAEARSVNHRHLDITLRLPRALASLEMDARRLIQSRLERGRVEVTVQLSPLAGQPGQRVQIDDALAREYLARAGALRAALADTGVGGGLPLTWVLGQPGVVRLEEAEPLPAAPWPPLADALGRALDELVARRATEGERLAGALRERHAELAATVDQMAARAPVAVARREERLRERLRALLGDTPLDESRLLTEAAIWADKTDVTEELTRLRVHLGELVRLLDKGGPVGRPLDFLIQELNREINTVASKADDLELSQAAIAAKGVLEKIREQAQNLE